MKHYTNAELSDMLFVYDRNNENDRQTQRLKTELHPECVPPLYTINARLYQR